MSQLRADRGRARDQRQGAIVTLRAFLASSGSPAITRELRQLGMTGATPMMAEGAIISLAIREARA